MKNQVDPDQKVTDAAVTPAENTSPADTQAEQTPVSPAPETAPQPETPQEAEFLQKFCPQCGAWRFWQLRDCSRQKNIWEKATSKLPCFVRDFFR